MLEGIKFFWRKFGSELHTVALKDPKRQGYECAAGFEAGGPPQSLCFDANRTRLPMYFADNGIEVKARVDCSRLIVRVER